MEHQEPEPKLKAVHVHGDLQRKHAEHAARASAKYSTHSSRPRTRGEPLEPLEIGTWHRIQPRIGRMRFIVRGEAQMTHSSQHAKHAHEHARDMHTYSRSPPLSPRVGSVEPSQLCALSKHRRKLQNQRLCRENVSTEPRSPYDRVKSRRSNGGEPPSGPKGAHALRVWNRRGFLRRHAGTIKRVASQCEASSSV